MRKILEELYHGNLSVDERTVRAGSKYARALAEVAKLRKRYTKDFRRRIMPCCEIMRWPTRSWRMYPWWRTSSQAFEWARRL